VILLLFNLAMVMKPDFFGIEGDATEAAEIKAMKYSFVTVGIWWMVFSQYTFFHLPKGFKKEGKRDHIILNGFKELKMVWHHKALFRRLLCLQHGGTDRDVDCHVLWGRRNTVGLGF